MAERMWIRIMSNHGIMDGTTFTKALAWTAAAATAAADQISSLEAKRQEIIENSSNLDSFIKEATIHNEKSTIETLPLLPTPPEGHVTGGLPIISDAVFSLVILVYVSSAFCFVFFMFCWKSETNKGFEHQCSLTTDSVSDTNKANLKTNKVSFDTNKAKLVTNKVNFDTNKVNFDTNKVNFDTNKVNFDTNKVNFDTSKANLVVPETQVSQKMLLSLTVTILIVIKPRYIFKDF